MGKWQEFLRFKHPNLRKLVSEIPHVVMNARRPNTMTAYASAYKRFEEWAETLDEIKVFPTDEYSASLYVITLTQENKSMATIRQFVASMSWIHKLGGFQDPSESHLFQTLLQGVKRTTPGDVTHKKPVEKERLYKLHDMLFSQGKMLLKDVRDFTYILLSFYGFLRFDEASKVKRCNIQLNCDYFVLHIPRSKTDVRQEGQEVFIARTSTKICPLTWMVRYLSIAGIKNGEDVHIFRSVYFCRKTNQWGLRKADKPLAYSTLAEMFKERMTAIGANMEKLSLHSLRAGGVTLAAAQGVAERLYKAHGRWTSDAVQAHVSEVVKAKLSVTKCMDN